MNLRRLTLPRDHPVSGQRDDTGEDDQRCGGRRQTAAGGDETFLLCVGNVLDSVAQETVVVFVLDWELV